MSDLEPETADRPSDATISRTLRDVVVATHKTGKPEDLTVKRVRSKAEEQLGLSAGFFKTSPEWKQKSHDAILAAVETYCGDDPVSNTEPEPKPKPKTKAKPPPKQAVKPKPPPKKAKPTGEKPSGVKRKSSTPAKKPQKRRKTTISSDDESDAVMSDLSVKEDTSSNVKRTSPKQLVQRVKKVISDDSDEEEHAPSLIESKGKDERDKQEPVEAAPVKEREKIPVSEIKDDDSDMSSLIDESPRKKKQLPKKSGKETKSKAAATTKPKGRASKQKDEDSPDQAEIKRLQSWLVKCGIRKVWVKELANCDTPKDKIKHLKGMLKDAGMDGKYSNERAAKIKEQREFAKDLEAIQEGAKAWGEPGAEDSGRPRRRLNRGVQKVVRKYEEDEDDDNEVNDNAKADENKSKEDENGETKVKPKVKSKAKGHVKAAPNAKFDDSEEEEDFEADDNDSDDEVKFSSEDESAGDVSE